MKEAAVNIHEANERMPDRGHRPISDDEPPKPDKVAALRGALDLLHRSDTPEHRQRVRDALGQMGAATIRDNEPIIKEAVKRVGTRRDDGSVVLDTRRWPFAVSASGHLRW